MRPRDEAGAVRKMKKKTAAPRWKAEATAAENARAGLAAALAHFLLQGDRLAAAGAGNPAALHQLRLAAKHIRYGLEAFQSVYGARLGDLLDRLRETQQKLGSISDATATRRWLVKQGLGSEASAAAVMAYLDQRASKEAKEFGIFWREHWKAPAFRDRWARYLVRYAGVRQPGQPAQQVAANDAHTAEEHN